LDAKNYLNFSGETIEIKDMNINEDIIEVYLLQDNKKIKSNKPEQLNYCKIQPLSIKIKNDFEKINVVIVNNIKASFEIKIKNKPSVNTISVKDNIKMFSGGAAPKTNQDSKIVNNKKKEGEIGGSAIKGKSNHQKTNNSDFKLKTEEKKSVVQLNDKIKMFNQKKIENCEKKGNINPVISTIQQERIQKINSLFERKGAKSVKDNKGTVQKEEFEILEEEEVPEVFLEPTKYTKFIEDQKKNGIKNPSRETFCEAFFIASFPKKSGNVIEMSNTYEAVCGHKECSNLPAMKPEIIFRYPLNDTKNLELNNLAATICFPTGIKVCYSETEEPKKMVDYFTSITNQKGERYYMMNFHIYLRMQNVDYIKEYEEHPLKYNLRKFAEAYIGLGEKEIKEKENEITTNLESSQELGFRDYVYVPFCICLISKYAYVQEMKKCLSSIYSIIKKDKGNSSKINDIIMYLINSIPIPPKNRGIKFTLPYSRTAIKVNCPKLEDMNVANLTSSLLLKYFSIDNLIFIFRLLITEKKILLIDNDYEKLSNVADGLFSILYPFPWIHTYIPIMSDQMLKYLETFLPFLNGIHESLMPLVEKIFKDSESEADDEVFLIYIKDNKIKLSSSLKGNSIKFEKYVQEHLANIPSQLEKELRHKLKKAKSELEDIEKAKSVPIDRKRNLELQFRDAFIDLFVELLKEYPNFLSMLDDLAIFNKQLFLEKISPTDKKFYSDLLDTQLFEQFTQSIVTSDLTYFNDKIAQLEQDKDSKNKAKKEIKCEKYYCIIPEFMKTQKVVKKMINFEKDLINKYPEEKDQNLILDKPIKIDNSKYIDDNCLIYFTPEELEANVQKPNNNNNEEAAKKKTNLLKKIKSKGQNAKKKKEGLSELEKETIKEAITDFIAPIFKSDVENMETKEKTDLLKKLNTSFGREFFISILSKNTSNVILLKENSCHLLFQLINECILHTLKLEETDKILEEIVVLIKCTKYFGIQVKKKIETMFDLNINKLGDLPKLKQANFWRKWYDLELRNNEKGKGDKEFKQNVIYSICQTLIALEYPKSMVKNFTDQINEKEFGKNSDTYKATFKKLIEFITGANYISKAI
jgi:hypothetical protein